MKIRPPLPASGAIQRANGWTSKYCGTVKRMSAPTDASALHRPINTVRFVTAASLFDGHDAAINIMRRLLQAQGAEVVHLGHDRSVDEVVTAAIQEDVQGVAVSSYQGGHLEYFTYLVDRLRAEGRGDIRVYGGGGGTIVASEIAELQRYGVARIFSPQDGQELGLAAMVNLMLAECDQPRPLPDEAALEGLLSGDERALARRYHGPRNRCFGPRGPAPDRRGGSPAPGSCSGRDGHRWLRQIVAH